MSCAKAVAAVCRSPSSIIHALILHQEPKKEHKKEQMAPLVLDVAAKRSDHPAMCLLASIPVSHKSCTQSLVLWLVTQIMMAGSMTSKGRILGFATDSHAGFVVVSLLTLALISFKSLNEWIRTWVQAAR